MHTNKRIPTVFAHIACLSMPALVHARSLPQTAPPALATAVARHIAARGETSAPRFEYALADLNGDGRLDAIVLVRGQEWCGSGGCAMWIFQGTSQGFVFVSGSTIASPPIRMANARTNGWHDLIVSTAISAATLGEVVLHFNGDRYPLNPSLQPHATPAEIRNTKTLVANP
jgi:hypothetical protein